MEHSTALWNKLEREYSYGYVSFPRLEYALKVNKLYQLINWKIKYFRDMKIINQGNFGLRDIIAEMTNPEIKKVNYHTWWRYPKILASERFAIEFSSRTPGSALREVVFEGYYFSFPDFIPSERDTIVDVGAQFGDYSILCSVFFPNAKIIAFEPLEHVYSAFMDTVKLNSLKNIRIHMQAVGKENGKTGLLKRGNMAVISEIGDANDSAEIEVVTIDSAVNEKVDLLKIDVEGFEMSVIEGAANTIDMYHPKIIVEAHSIDLKRKVTRKLQSLGYELKHLGNKNYSDLDGMDIVQNLYFAWVGE